MNDAQKIISEISKGHIKPIYFLSGEEPYFIDLISDYIESHVLSEDEQAFNQSILYGRDMSVEEVVSYAKRFPMMADHQVLILKEAQDMPKLLDGAKSGKKSKEKPLLQRYFEQPQPSTVLVICYKYKKVDKRKAVYKAAKKNGIVFESKKLYDNQIPVFISTFLKDKGYTITPKAALMLVEFLGTDLGKITNELGKLQIVVPEGTAITPELIEENIGISKDFNVFELQKALGHADFEKAFRIVNYFGQNPKNHPLLGTLPMLYRYFVQLLTYHGLSDKSQNNVAAKLGVHPFFVKDFVQGARTFSMKECSNAIAVFRDIDVKAKGVGASSVSESDLLKELLVKIAG